MKELWQRAQKQLSESESRVRAETQVIHGEEFDVWRWIQPKSSSSPSSPRKKRSVSDRSPPSTFSHFAGRCRLGITEELERRKLRFCAHGRRSNRMFETEKFLRSRSVRRSLDFSPFEPLCRFLGEWMTMKSI